MSKAANADLQHLEAFVGQWRTEGEVLATDSGPFARFHAKDTYEWLPGGFFLVHRWDAHLPDGESQGIEIIGYDAETRTYPMHTYDNQGNIGVMHAHVEGGTWKFLGESMRFSGEFCENGNVIKGVWELRASEAEGWSPWMTVTLTKVG